MFKPYFVHRLSPTSPSKLKMDSHFWPSWRETLKDKIVIVHQSLRSRDSQSEKRVNAKRGAVCSGEITVNALVMFLIMCNVAALTFYATIYEDILLYL